MSFLGGHRPRPTLPAGPPAWLVGYYLRGDVPEHDTPEHGAYLRARFLDRLPGRSWPSLDELIAEHREALDAASEQR